MRPSPHRCPTWHQPPGGRQARVVPAPEAPTATAQGRRSSLPSPQAQRPAPPHGAQGGQSCGTGLHLLMGDVEQHVGVDPSMLSITKVTVNLL
jgi:hypothetical protein